MSYEVIPAILARTYGEIKEKLALVRGAADTVQVDTCDGRFADNLLWPYVEKGRADDADFRELLSERKGLPFWNELDYEFDLMVQEPESIIADFVRIGASRLLVHLESTERMEDIIHEWKDSVEIGIALRPSTSLEELESYLHEIRLVQFMGSDNIAHAGVALDERIYGRLREFKKKHPEHIAAVDIGVNVETAPDLVAAGADRLVAGSAIFKSPDIKGAIKQLSHLV
jgi:ribulose-phosphate 3-epimerase